jgi:hypothetical protein
MAHDVSGSILVTVIALGVAGLGLAAVALLLTRRDLRRIRAGHVADARVIALIPIESFEHVTTYRTQVEFRDRTGTLHHMTTSSGESPAPYKVGDLARVAYDPADPGGARLIRWFWHIAAGASGVVAILAAALLYWAAATGRVGQGS